MLARIGTFVVLQGTWFAAVLGAARGAEWLGPLAVAALVAAILARAADRRPALARLLGLTAAGTALDSGLATAGVISFAGTGLGSLAPPWISSLWAHLALLLRSPMAFLHRRPWLAAAIGAVGGPAAYRLGVALGAAEFPAGAGRAAVIQGIAWAAALPLAARFVHPAVPSPRGGAR